MRARAFTKRVSFYKISEIDDGFGGKTTAPVLLLTTWANITTKLANIIGNEGKAVIDLGLDYTVGVIQITMRSRSDITINSSTDYLIYRGEKYNISSYPTNQNFTDAIITFRAIKQK